MCILMSGGIIMQTGSFLLTLGVGMAAGATVMLMMPSQNKIRKAAQKAADAMENAVQKCGETG